MLLVWLILIPLAGGLIAWMLAQRHAGATRWIALAAMGLDLALALTLWTEVPGARGPWLAEIACPWIPALGVSFHLAADGLSLLLITLTAFLGILAVLCSWTEINERVGFFHFNLLWTLAGIIGVFTALDLFLFYFFWEVMLVPMYFLIALWGHERRLYASVKFFLFTQLSGLLMLAAILGLYFIHWRATGERTFDYERLLETTLSGTAATWLMLGFFIAFAVKLPAVPFHTWLPDAHTEAPTAGSVILAGLLLKTGAYGLLRFVVPLFPQAAHAFAPAAMTLGVIGILYGAFLAFAQTDLKRLIACSSISHMGFILLGVFACNQLALAGTVVQILSHGVVTGGLFIFAGALGARLGTRDLRRMGGLWTTAPRLGGVTLFLALAAMGLPGLSGFVGEFLILLGVWRVSIPLAMLGAAGAILSVIYALYMVQRVFHGTPVEGRSAVDLTRREGGMALALIVVIVALGLYPLPVLRAAQPPSAVPLFGSVPAEGGWATQGAVADGQIDNPQTVPAGGGER